MRQLTLLLLLLSTTLLVGMATAAVQTVYVCPLEAHEGGSHDQIPCGLNQTNPCLTLDAGLKQAQNTSQSNILIALCTTKVHHVGEHLSLVLSGVTNLEITSYGNPQDNADLNLNSTSHLHAVLSSPYSLKLKKIALKNGNGPNTGGGCLYFKGMSSSSIESSSLKLENCEFRKCISSGNGGAVSIENSLLSIENSVFDRCFSTGSGGGAVFAKGCGLIQVNLSSFSHCQVQSVTVDDDVLSTGGALSLESTSIQLNSSIFQYNNASSLWEDEAVTAWGGALSVKYYSESGAITNPQPVSIFNCTFSDNHAIAWVRDSYTATSYGGAVAVSYVGKTSIIGTSTRVDRCTFLRNSNPSVSRSGQRGKDAISRGGALFIRTMEDLTNDEDNVISVSNSIFIDNMATCYFMDRGEDSFTHQCSKTLDERKGGAIDIWMKGDDVSTRNTITIFNVNCTNNFASNYLIDRKVTSADSTTSVVKGGAINIEVLAESITRSQVIVEQSTFDNSMASAYASVKNTGQGGALNIELLSTDPMLDNVVRVRACAFMRSVGEFKMFSLSSGDAAGVVGGGALSILINGGSDTTSGNSVVIDSVYFSDSEFTSRTRFEPSNVGGGAALVSLRGDPLKNNEVNITNTHSYVGKLFSEAGFRSNADGGCISVKILGMDDTAVGNHVYVSDSSFDQCQSNSVASEVGGQSTSYGGCIHINQGSTKHGLKDSVTVVANCSFNLGWVYSQSLGISKAIGGGVAFRMSGEHVITKNIFRGSDLRLTNMKATINGKVTNPMQYGTAQGTGIALWVLTTNECSDQMLELDRIDYDAGVTHTTHANSVVVKGAGVSFTGDCRSGQDNGGGPSVLVIRDSTIKNALGVANSMELSSAYGGAISVVSRLIQLHVTVLRTTMHKNTVKAESDGLANCVGGGMYISFMDDSGCRVHVNDSVIDGNDASGSDANVGGGVAVFLDSSLTDFLVSNTLINKNTARSGGGMVVRIRGAKHPLVLVDGATFSSNSALNENSGGFLISHDAIPSWASAPVHSHVLRNTVFRGNYAKTTAGAIHVANVDMTLDSVQIINNEAGSLGGGLVGASQANVTIDGSLASPSLFSGNVAHRGQHGVLESSAEFNFGRASFYVAAQAEFMINCPTCPLSKTANTQIHCPIGSPYKTSANAWLCLTCPRNYYSVGDTACQTCIGEGGMECDGGAGVSALHGFQVLPQPSGGVKSYLCPPGYCCSQATCLWNSSCAMGRDSSVPYCGKCISGYTESLGSPACVPTSTCGSSLAWGMFALLVVLIILYCVRQLMMSPTPKVGALKSAMYFFQSTQLVTVSSSPGIIAVSALFSLDLNGLGILGSGLCLVEMSAEWKMLLSGLFVPLVVPLLVTVIGLSIPKNVLPRRRLSMALMSITLTIYSSIAKLTLSLVHCKEGVGADMVLFLAGSIKCYDQWFQYLAYFLLLPAVFSFPIVLVFAASRSHKKRMARRENGTEKSEDDGGALKFLTVAYRDKCWYYEGVVMGRRLVLTTVVTFVSNVVTRSFLLLVFSFVFLLLHVLIRPFRLEKVNYMETAELAFIGLLAGFGIRDADRLQTGQIFEDQSIDITAYLMYAMTIIFLLSVYFQDWISKLRKLRSERKGRSMGNMSEKDDSAATGSNSGAAVIELERVRV